MGVGSALKLARPVALSVDYNPGAASTAGVEQALALRMTPDQGHLSKVLMQRIKSEQVVLRLGEFEPVALIGADAEARGTVIRLGKQTGFEYGVAVVDGSVVRQFTANKPSALMVPSFAGLTDVVVHHNHPMGDSLSAQDFNMLLSRDEITRIVAHGHNGLYAEASVSTHQSVEQAMLATAWAKDRARRALVKAVGDGLMSFDLADAGLWPVLMAIYLQQDGLARYTLNSTLLLQLASQIISHANPDA